MGKATDSLGDLITTALVSPNLNITQVGVAMKHALRTTSGNYFYVEDILLHVIRAFEALAVYRGYSSTDLLADLPEDAKRQVRECMKQAAKEIRQIAVDEHSKASLKRIADRVSSFGYKEGSLGLSIIKLMEEYGFVDNHVVDAHYSKFSPSIQNTDRYYFPNDFVKAVAVYRGASVHEGALDFDNKHEAEDSAIFTVFLHDLLVRIIFKMMGYTGAYRPFIFGEETPQRNVGWVTVTTSPQELGFQLK